jgi:formylmethanofuran dehydrogenase subunit E
MPLQSFDEYVALAEAAHGHMCAGQILGLRLAIYGVKLLGIDDPTGKDRKRLVCFVEIDRCATDAVPIVTGCRMGKRALKFRDFGKVAATFCDLQADRAIRVVAKESSKKRAKELYPQMADKNAQQMRAYREMPEEELFDIQWVRVQLGPEDMPGYKAGRVVCAECGEGINFKREVERDGRTLCRACAGERYYEVLETNSDLCGVGPLVRGRRPRRPF